MTYIPSLHRRSGYHIPLATPQAQFDIARAQFLTATLAFLQDRSVSRADKAIEVSSTNSALAQMVVLLLRDQAAERQP